MTRSVFYILLGAVISIFTKAVKYCSDDLLIIFLRPRGDVVYLSRLSGHEDVLYCPVVILDMNPIPDVLACAVDGDLQAQGDSDNGLGNEFLRKLVRPVVVSKSGEPNG